MLQRHSGELMEPAEQLLGRSRPVMRSTRVIARIFLGGVFLWAGADGLSTRSAHVESSALLDKWLANNSEARIAFDVIECMLGVWIALGLRERAGVLAGILVLSAFTGALATELKSDQPKPCGCFGAAAAMSDPATIARYLKEGILRNLGLIAIATTLYLSPKNE